MTRTVRFYIELFLVVLAFIAVRFLNIRDLIEAMLRAVRDLGFWGPIIFVLAYVLATMLFIPGSLLTLGAGAVFGLLRGFISVSIGATLGASAAFLIGRYFSRDWISKKMETNSKLKALNDAVAKEGSKIVFLVRLSPVFPFNLMNYVFGITKIPLKDYFFWSWLGMIPGTLMYVYLGSVAGSLVSATSGSRSKTPLEWSLYTLGLFATIAVTIYVTRLAKRTLQEKVS